ncbi:MAG: ComEC family competence protein, partial [Bacteroidetes bacterium]|nr:ComEC family competence protein [Bacteroidota bacterium]
MKWQPYPMLRISGFFIGGVLLGIYQPDLVSIQLVTGLILFCSLLFFIIRLLSIGIMSGLYSGVLGLSVIFFLGYSRLTLFTDSRNENHLSKIKESIEAYEAIVLSVPEEKAKSWKVEVEIFQAKTGSLPSSKFQQTSWKLVTGKLLLYISKKNNSGITWRYGDKVLVKGNPQELNPPSNPGEFDFKRFLSFKNISHQQFVAIDEVKLISEASSKSFIYYSHQARAWCMKKMNQFVHGGDERAIAVALVLGVTDGIDNDLQNAYAASGAMHVLAVSGMHVGIIYAIILFLFKPLNKLRNSKWIVAIVSLICLWSFSFITGNSPSVLRAVTMFSFIAMARPFGMRTNIYNTLAASAFVLLIYNPYLIMSVGFQLSYLAVLGIVYLQRPLYQLWEIENTLGDWTWKITCVSIAAQASTFALGLLYFHQFPTYFLVSNLFVIPLSTLVLVGGIFLLGISFISSLASFVGLILEWLIKALNWIVFKTEALPMSLINNIHLTIFQCWLLMGILVLLILLFEFKSVKWLYASFGLAAIFTVIQWNHFTRNVDQKQMIVYSINNHRAIEFHDQGLSYFNSDSLLINDAERIRFHIQPNRLIHGISETQTTIPFAKDVKGARYFHWDKKIIACIDDKGDQPLLNVPIDHLIVSQNSLHKSHIEKLNVKQIIFDGSNSRKY